MSAVDVFAPESDSAARWRAAVSRAARESLASRARATLELLEVARLEHRALYSAVQTDVRALRKAAQRVHDLEQLRAVLVRELEAA
jgi:hypothetical protein